MVARSFPENHCTICLFSFVYQGPPLSLSPGKELKGHQSPYLWGRQPKALLLEGKRAGIPYASTFLRQQAWGWEGSSAPMSYRGALGLAADSSLWEQGWGKGGEEARAQSRFHVLLHQSFGPA